MVFFIVSSAWICREMKWDGTNSYAFLHINNNNFYDILFLILYIFHQTAFWRKECNCQKQFLWKLYQNLSYPLWQSRHWIYLICHSHICCITSILRSCRQWDREIKGGFNKNNSYYNEKDSHSTFSLNLKYKYIM